MPYILVPLAVNTKAGTPMHCARESYIKKFVKYNLTPLFISSLAPQKTIDELYALSNGIFFMGGGDFDPMLYGEEKKETTDISEPKRDMLELAILKKALTDKKPYLGICRGCQALAIASHGSLYQHIPDLAPQEHHGISEGGTYDDLLNKSHGINILEGTKTYQILGTAQTNVHCGHHQAIHNPGNDIIISAKSPAGIAEIIEHIDPNYFCMGIQSHPEVDENGTLENIFKAFASAISKS